VPGVTHSGHGPDPFLMSSRLIETARRWLKLGSTGRGRAASGTVDTSSASACAPPASALRLQHPTWRLRRDDRNGFAQQDEREGANTPRFAGKKTVVILRNHIGDPRMCRS
jgi:hypothetical protein